MKRRFVLDAACVVVLVACGKRADTPAKAASLPNSAGLDTSSPGTAAVATPLPKFDRWIVTTDTSPMDGTVSTHVGAISDGTTPGAGYAALLFIRCSGPKLEVFFNTDDILDYDTYDGVPVRIRIDSAPAEPRDWTKSENSRAAFAPEPRALFTKLRSAHRLLMEIPVYGRGRQIAAWSLDGLSDHIGALPCVQP